MALPSGRPATALPAPSAPAAEPPARPALRGPRAPGVDGRRFVMAEPLEARQLLAAQPGVQLINSATDQVIGSMYDGMRIDMGTVGTKLNIRAVPTGTAGRIVFKIDGVSVRTEATAPYAIGGNDGNDYRDWTPPVGAHTLEVLQYAAASGGAATASKTIAFTAVASGGGTPVPTPSPLALPAPALKLINASTDAVLSTLTDGATINLGLTGDKLSVEATGTAAVASVVFKVDGEVLRVESFQPFTIAGDADGDYWAWTPSVGAHKLEVVPYTLAGAKGQAGTAAVVNFTVVAATGPADPPVVVPPVVVPPVVVPPPVIDPNPTDDGSDGDAPPGTVSNGGSPTAVIKVIGQTGVAGLPVVVNGTTSALPNSPLYAKYQWDFGDPDGKYNRLPGWEAGHVYDAPGVYTLKLTVTDGNGRSDSASTTVTVTDDNRRVVYVDKANGNDANPGTIGSPIASFEAASRAVKNGNVKVLFRRGQTWNTTAWMSISGDDTHVGAYGTGANPVLNVVSGDCAIHSFDAADHTVIENLTFDSPYKPNGDDADKMGSSGIYVDGTDVAIRDCTFLNVTDGINANGQPTGLIVMDNDAPLTTGVRGYLLWTEGQDIVVVGNSAANSTREHVMRVRDGNRLLVAYNNFTNLGRWSVDPQDDTKGTIEMQRGSWAYIYGNTTRDGPIRVGPRGEDTEPFNTTTEWVVVENNKIYNYQVNVFPGAHHVMVRDNVAYEDNRTFIALNPTDPEGRTLADINVVGNTVYDSAKAGQFLRTSSGLRPGTVTVGKNTWVAPNIAGGVNGNAPMYVLMSDLSGFKLIYDNLWPTPASNIKYAQGGVMWVAPSYTGQAGYKDPTEWLAYANVTGDLFKTM